MPKKCNPKPRVRQAGKDLSSNKTSKATKSKAGTILKKHQDKNH